MDTFGDDGYDEAAYDMPSQHGFSNHGVSGGGSPFNNNQPGQTVQDEDRDGDPKRRRIARACDMCRKKKIKCDGRMPKCSHCINYKTECIFTPVEKKRNPPKGAKYIEGLENRMRRLEGLLRMAGIADSETDIPSIERRLQHAQQQSQHGDLNNLHPVTPAPAAAAATAAAARPSLENHGRSQSTSLHSTPQLDSGSSPRVAESPATQDDKELEVEALSEMMCSLVTNNCGETRYIGSSSGFSIFSPRGIEWVNVKTGDTSFRDMVQSAVVDDNKWLYWKPEIFSDIFARRVFKPLPSKEEAISLFRDFFDNFNTVLPLFHEPTFMHLVDRQYSPDPYEGSGWWACINIVLAVAYRLRVMSHLVPQDEDKKAWLYLKNAMGVLTELTMRNTDLLSVQALLGMALFLQGTPNPQPSFFLVAAAIRLSHSIGLHKKGTLFNLNPAEAEQRKRVFWIAYMLDKDICLRSGRPPVQDDDDMNVELPSEIPPDNVGIIPLEKDEGNVNIFRVMCRFAIIQSRVYKRLYSTTAARQSDGELLNTIGELDKELEEWKDSIPLEYRPEHEITATHPSLILNLMVLHFAYYNCLTTIHRMAVHHGYWTSRLSNYALQGLNARPLNPRVFSSANLCVSAARSSINLIKYIPQGDFACVWLVLYYPVSALVTLFANILQNPQDARARSDIKLMNVVVNFLSALVPDDSNGSVMRMLSICTEFERIAKVVLDKAEKEALSKRKRKATAETFNTNTNTNNTAQGMEISEPANQPFNTGTSFFQSTEQHHQHMLSVRQSTAGIEPATSGDVLSSTFGNMSGANMPMFETEVPYNGQSNLQSPIPVTSAASPSDAQFLPFQQSFVPQDLWQMPMTLEWDWADFNTINLPNVDQSDMFQMNMQNGT